MTVTFSYGGNHRYLGNAFQGAQNWTNLGLPIKVVPAAKGTVGDITFTDVNVKDGYNGQTEAPASWQSKNPPYDVPWTTKLSSYNVPTRINIKLNMRTMDPLNDFQRSKVTTHEIGHALGLGHTDSCGLSTTSILNQGSSGVGLYPFNSPQYYDRSNLQQLYDLPTG